MPNRVLLVQNGWLAPFDCSNPGLSSMFEPVKGVDVAAGVFVAGAGIVGVGVKAAGGVFVGVAVAA